MFRTRHILAAAAMLLVAVLLPTTSASAATVEPGFADHYTLTELGVPEDLPSGLAGMTLKVGDPDTLLVAADGNTADGAIYAVPLLRDAGGKITGYAGPATFYANAPFIDGGLSYFPGTDVLAYTTFPSATIEQLLPGSTDPDRSTDLRELGIPTSAGSLNFVPDFAPGAGRLRVLTYAGNNYSTMPYSLGDDGTFDIGPATVHLALDGGLEGIESVPPGSPGFEDHSVVIAKYNMGAIDAYEVDAEGTPIPSTKRPFVTDLSHVLGAYLDPVSGSFLFSTWWTDSTIVVVEGFARADSVDLGITVSAPASAIVGDEMVVDLEVTNHGPGASAPTTASVALPAGLTYSDAATGCAHAGSSLTCAIPALDAGASITRSITLTAGGAESLTVSATVPVTRLDPVGANNSDSSTVVVSSPTTTTTTTTTAPTTTTEEGGSSTTVAPETATTAAVGGAGLTASTTVSSEGSAPPARGSLPRTGASIPPVALGVSLTLVGFLFAIGARHRRVVSGRD